LSRSGRGKGCKTMASHGAQVSAEQVRQYFNLQLKDTWALLGPEVTLRMEQQLAEGMLGSKRIDVPGVVVPLIWMCPFFTIDPSMKVKSAKLHKVDLSSPPGFTSYSDSEIGFAAPLEGAWRLGVELKVDTSITGIGNTEIRAVIDGLRLAVILKLDHQDRRRPTVTDANADIRWNKIDLDADRFLVGCALEFIEKFIARTLLLEKTVTGVLGLLTSLYNDLDIHEPRESLLGKFRQKLIGLPLEELGRSSPFVFHDKSGSAVELCWSDAQETKCDFGAFLTASRDIFDYEQVANRIDQVINQQFLPVDTVVTRHRTKGYENRVGDSATYTGYFLIGQAVRYSLTRSQEALTSVKRLLTGIGRMLEVGSSNTYRLCAGGEGSPVTCQDLTSPPKGEVRPDELRLAQFVAMANACVFDVAPGSACPKTWREYFEARSAKHGEPESVRTLGGEEWLGISASVSRDPYLGVTCGLAFAFKLVDEPEVRATVRRLITGILRYLLRRAWTSWDPRGDALDQGAFFATYPHVQLPMLLLAAAAAPGDNWRLNGDPPETFAETLDKATPLAFGMWLPIWFSTLNPVEGYFHFSLSHVALAACLLLESDPVRLDQYRRCARLLRQAISHHQNPFFTSLLAVDPVLRAEFQQQDEGWKTFVQLHQFLQRPRSETPIDVMTAVMKQYHAELVGQGLAGANPYRERAGKELFNFLRKKEDEETSPKFLSHAVIPVDMRVPRVFFEWARDPFDLAVNESGGLKEPWDTRTEPTEEGPGFDYTTTYWLARRAGFLVHLGVDKGPGGRYTTSETVTVSYMIPSQDPFELKHLDPAGKMNTVVSAAAGQMQTLTLPIGLAPGDHKLTLLIRGYRVAECLFTIVP